MTDATTEFFEELAARGHEPALAKVTGTLRFDLRDGGARAERWLITIDEGRRRRLAQERQGRLRRTRRPNALRPHRER